MDNNFKKNKMSILTLSDIHLDFYFKFFSSSPQKTERVLTKFCNETIKIPSIIYDVIIVAGDIGHYNSDNKEFLKFLRDYYGAVVLFTSGNHDLYLISNKQKNKYNFNSLERIEDMKNWSTKQKNIYFLDGDYIDIQEVRFGGVSNWYDGSYLRSKTENLNDLWKIKMNDYHYILKDGEKYRSFLDIKKDLKVDEKWNNLRIANCDYIFTHVSPVIDEDLIDPMYKNEILTSFYTSSAINLKDFSNLKYLQYGHVHVNIKKIIDGIQFFNSSIGYPFELKHKKASFNIINIG